MIKFYTFRIFGVLLLVFIANQYRLHKLKMVDQFVMMYGGLRGAVAFALVLLIDKKVRLRPSFSVLDNASDLYVALVCQNSSFLLDCKGQPLLIALAEAQYQDLIEESCSRVSRIALRKEGSGALHFRCDTGSVVSERVAWQGN